MEMAERFLMHGGSGPTGSVYTIWEYELTAPRMLNSPNLASRFAVKRMVETYNNHADAWQALMALREE